MIILFRIGKIKSKNFLKVQNKIIIIYSNFFILGTYLVKKNKQTRNIKLEQLKPYKNERF